MPESIADRIRRWAESRFAALVLLFGAIASTNAQGTQFSPEIDAHVSINSFMQANLQLKQTLDGENPTESERGASLDFYLKPWVKLSSVTNFDPDQTKRSALVFSVGCAALHSPNAAPVKRAEWIATANLPLRGGWLMSERNQTDLDWQAGPFVWRYHNRISLEETLPLASYHPVIFLHAESFYESKFQRWSTTALYAGVRLPISSHVVADPYYLHQNFTGGPSNQTSNQVGLIANLYFSTRRKSPSPRSAHDSPNPESNSLKSRH